MNKEPKIKNGEIVYILNEFGNVYDAIKGMVIKCIMTSSNESDLYQVLGDDKKIYKVYYPYKRTKTIFLLTQSEYLEYLNNLEKIDSINNNTPVLVKKK